MKVIPENSVVCHHDKFFPVPNSSTLQKLQNSVSKHEYLGEYTGELISHREADKRGKIYDRENSSFLFNLNDQARITQKIFLKYSTNLEESD